MQPGMEVQKLPPAMSQYQQNNSQVTVPFSGKPTDLNLRGAWTFGTVSNVNKEVSSAEMFVFFIVMVGGRLSQKTQNKGKKHQVCVFWPSLPPACESMFRCLNRGRFTTSCSLYLN